jgi:hypothetical protein
MRQLAEATVLKRSGSKNIVVDGRQYRYVVSEAQGSGDTGVSLAITVQNDQQNGAHLRIAGLAVRRVPAERSKFYKGRTIDRPIEPRHVERLIRLAFSQGWQPMSPGRPFILDVGGADVFGSMSKDVAFDKASNGALQ